MPSGPNNIHTGSVPTQTIGFFFNAQLHHIFHAMPLAVALSRDPRFSVDIVAMTDDHVTLAREIARDQGADALRFRRIGGKALSALTYLSGRTTPPKMAALLAARRQLARYDALVVPERTSLALRSLGLRRTRFIHTCHGAGDRAVGYDRRIRLFDFVLLAGEKQKRRMLDMGLIRAGHYAIVGYGKFDLTKDRPVERLFPNDKPVVLYNPHFSEKLSSWPDMGLDIVRQFARDDRFNLIVAPHIRLYDDRRKRARMERCLAPYAALPHIHVDLGSPASVDMRYARAASVYLGDVSSQIYEFVVQPRPCLFLNAHGAQWQGDPSYRHWRYGPVHDSCDAIVDKVADAIRTHPAGRGAGDIRHQRGQRLRPGRAGRQRLSVARPGRYAKRRRCPARGEHRGGLLVTETTSAPTAASPASLQPDHLWPEHLWVVARVCGPDEGGVQTYVAQVAQAYAALGHRVTLFAKSSVGPRRVVDGAVTLVDVGPGSRLGVYLRLALAMAAAWRRGERPEAIHACTWRAALPALPFPRPLAITVHGREVGRPTGAAFRLMRTVLRKARRIVAVSDATRALLLERLPELADACVTAWNGVTMPPENPASAPAPETPRAEASETTMATVTETGSGTATDALAPTRIITVCRLVERKNVPAAVQAVAACLADGMPLTYAVIGRGDQADAVRACVRLSRKDGIELTGYVDAKELERRYRTADIFLHPQIALEGGAEMEGFGLSVADAMAHGLACIVGRDGGPAELVRDGVTGLVIDGRNPQAIRAAVAILAEDPALRHTLGTNARLFAQTHFQWERHCRLVLEGLTDRETRRPHPAPATAPEGHA